MSKITLVSPQEGRALLTPQVRGLRLRKYEDKSVNVFRECSDCLVDRGKHRPRFCKYIHSVYLCRESHFTIVTTIFIFLIVQVGKVVTQTIRPRCIPYSEIVMKKDANSYAFNSIDVADNEKLVNSLNFKKGTFYQLGQLFRQRLC